ncbi:hypothetical protein X747_05850 [Mesorhizobium sp. LNJC384A00]|nr:hypothetical protein X766_16300 [Mesorhizobium sp. LSJC255A00]ESX25275.1 hypothetical protein X765_25840 [Mesorhizobium sp. LSHC440B00]ESX36520.1 hypothetical protein X763_16780 [Mesorhizobium sp. LSHC432A00]ESX38308.1 hypothetical protein X764_22200 [Mesorhizobium sp. LSHC440A00]ESY29487.1 hypothetical protein X749_17345 [Mesorhizobium sp. LNJC391B00]ESY44044.1 hypothetical protein X747_05850 [Mesorhizobium sp. LNJC384A00]
MSFQQFRPTSGSLTHPIYEQWITVQAAEAGTTRDSERRCSHRFAIGLIHTSKQKWTANPQAAADAASEDYFRYI